MTFKKAMTDYMKFVKITKAKGTYNFHIGNSKRLIKYFGDIECEKIKRPEILDLIVHLQTKNPNISNATINKYVGLILRTLKSECKLNIEFDKLKEGKKLIQIVSNENIKKVFNYFERSIYPEHLRNLVMFRLLLDTGLRISELLSLKVSNINFGDSTIFVKETKTKSERIVFYTKATEVFINRYIISEKINDYMFIDLSTREKLKLDRIQKICQNLQKSLNINQSLSPHKWRHTFATHFTNQNGNIEVLRVLMGHNNILTTQRYLHVNTQKLKNEYFRVFE